MSISYYAVAQKQLVKADYRKIALYNKLINEEYNIPPELFSDVQNILGCEIYEGEVVSTSNKEVVEIDLKGDGDIKYGNGLTIPISELPENTIAIRIYRA